MKIVYFMGGLGNQMFQYCFYKTLKLKTKNCYGDFSYMKVKNEHNGYELEEVFKIKVKEVDFFLLKNYGMKKNIFIRILNFIFRKIGIFYYSENWSEDIQKKINKKNIIIYNGCWQSEKFFKDISNEIKKEFSFPKIIDKKNLKLFEKIKDTNSISIHIRRGDYLSHKELEGLASLEYYQRAIEYIRKKVKDPYFFIFSNDIEWCKQNLDLKNCYYIDWNKGKESYRDMQLMSLCKHNIIPNSTFSWWGAWLNNNPQKIVIAPEKWFNDCSNLDYSNIVPETWIKIKNY